MFRRTEFEEFKEVRVKLISDLAFQRVRNSIDFTEALKLKPGFINAVFEFIKSPSSDEFGDILFSLGIVNKWSVRKIYWRGNHTKHDIKDRVINIFDSKFLSEYIESSNKEFRIKLYEETRGLLSQMQLTYENRSLNFAFNLISDAAAKERRYNENN